MALRLSKVRVDIRELEGVRSVEIPTTRGGRDELRRVDTITSVILLIVHTLRYIKSQKKRHFCTGRTLQISECHKLQRQSFGRNPTTRLSRL